MPIDLESKSSQIEALLSTGRDYLAKQRTVVDPVFDVRVGWSPDYDALLRAQFRETTSIDDSLKKALDGGRVMLVGQGGSGKSVALPRLMERALASRIIAVFVDLRQWTASDYDEWKESGRSGLFNQMSFLFDRFGQPSVSPLTLENLPVDTVKVVIIDGLNEIRGGAGDEVVRVADEYAREAIQTSIIVADRLTRRELRDPSRWAFGRVLPIAVTEIRNHLQSAEGQQAFEALTGGVQKLLQSPYFLDSFLREFTRVGSSSERLALYFDRHAGITGDELDRLASAAFDFYSEKGSRSFTVEDLTARLSGTTVDKLIGAGLLKLEGRHAYFVHHLLHDFLAARHVATNRLWNAAVFQRITLGASSFDTLVFVLEHIATEAESDTFVRLVYDWNPYGAAYVIGEGRARASIAVSAAMEFAMLAMLANRRFDLQKNTATRAADALAISPSPVARELLAAANIEAVIALVRSAPHQERWFVQWRDLFGIQPGADAPDTVINCLLDTDSVMGWTSANVLKRLRLTQVEQGVLRNEAENASPTVRWRVAHALGAFASEQNAKVVLGLMRDDDEWVRFGATRSLVELAARLDPKATPVFMQTIVDDVLGTLDERSRKELQSAVFLADRTAPEGWRESVALVFQAMLASANTVQEREAIEDVALRFFKWHHGSSR